MPELFRALLSSVKRIAGSVYEIVTIYCDKIWVILCGGFCVNILDGEMTERTLKRYNICSNISLFKTSTKCSILYETVIPPPGLFILIL